MRTGQGLQVHLLQYLQRLFVMPFLHLEHALHEVDLVGKRRVWKRLQVRFQVPLQQLVTPVKTSRQRIVLRLHLRRLSERAHGAKAKANYNNVIT